MQFIYEFVPVLLFFLAFKFYDIYVATVVGIVATSIQVAITRLWFRRWDKKELITLAVFLVFGGLTLYFHNPIFVKWKPTIIFWLFAVVILISTLTQRPLMQRLMENALQNKDLVPSQIWRRLNLIWAVFFLALGCVNLYVAYTFSNNAWVNFKFYGITSALFVLSIIQAVYLIRFYDDKNDNSN